MTTPLGSINPRTSPSVPVFSEDQIQFLAPLLAEGLRTAAPDQRIEYRVEATRQGSRFESSTTETTAGSLYAYGRQSVRDTLSISLQPDPDVPW